MELDRNVHNGAVGNNVESIRSDKGRPRDSSGGSGMAVSTRMLCVADGMNMMGLLHNILINYALALQE
jgi:hypothetical protein